MRYLLLAALIVAIGLLVRELRRVVAVARAPQRRVERRGDAARDARRLQALQPGGTPRTAVEVDAPSVVEAHAANRPCVVCEQRVDVEEHTVQLFEGERLRVARTKCRHCGHRGQLFFRLKSAPLLN